MSRKPSREKLVEEYAGDSTLKIAKRYGVSETAVRKWMIGYGIDRRNGHDPAKRAAAVARRLAGASIRQISREFSVSTSTATVWTRHLGPDVQLPPHRRGGKWKTDQARLDRETFRAEADRLWPHLSTNPAFMFGLAIYIGEGNKTGCCVGVSNCDPRVLVAAVDFMELVGIDRSKIRIGIQVHDDAQVAPSERFWCEQLSMDRSHLYKTLVVTSRSSKKVVKRVQLHGTASVRATSTRVACMISRWSDLALQRSSSG